jgi:hypothetical protein
MLSESGALQVNLQPIATRLQLLLTGLAHINRLESGQFRPMTVGLPIFS